jgi:hypothetical protein
VSIQESVDAVKELEKREAEASKQARDYAIRSAKHDIANSAEALANQIADERITRLMAAEHVTKTDRDQIKIIIQDSLDLGQTVRELYTDLQTEILQGVVEKKDAEGWNV